MVYWDDYIDYAEDRWNEVDEPRHLTKRSPIPPFDPISKSLKPLFLKQVGALGKTGLAITGSAGVIGIGMVPKAKKMLKVAKFMVTGNILFLILAPGPP